MTVLLSLSLKLLLSAITDFTISSARTPEFATEEARRRVSLFHTELVTLIPLHSYMLRGKLNRAPPPTLALIKSQSAEQDYEKQDGFPLLR